MSKSCANGVGRYWLCLFLCCFAVAPATAASLIRDAEIERTLYEYSAPIFEAAGLDPNAVRITIVNEDLINAFVAEGSNMYLFTGLLMAVNNAGELKGVIAHETGHIAGGHNITRQQAMSAARASSLLSLALGAIILALGAPEAGIAMMTGMEDVAVRNFFRHTRMEESSADQAGLTFLQKTGQSGAGMVSFMERIRKQDIWSERRRSPYYRTHPTGSERVAALRRRAASMGGRKQDEQAEHKLAMMQAKLTGFLKEPRQVRSIYPDSDVSMPARYARTIAAFRAVDMEAAHRDIDALIADDPTNPWFHELKGQILFESARAYASIAPHEKALSYAPQSPLLLVNLARSLLAVKGLDNVKRAEALLRRALALEPDNAFAWGQLANAHGAMGQKGMAELAIAEQAFVTGNAERAGIFAGRAAAHLRSGTAASQRAEDILIATRDEKKPGARRRRSERR